MKNVLLIVSVFILLIVSFFLIKNRNPFGDEYIHLEQISVFREGDFIPVKGISKLPGYFLTIAFLGNTSESKAIASYRTISFLISLVSILAYFILAREIDRNASVLKTVQYALIPIQFPFLLLLYTESLSNLLVFISFYLVIRKRFVAASLTSLLSLFVRQTNVVWLVFLISYSFVQSFGFEFRVSHFRKFLSKAFYLFIPLLVFLLFVIQNRGFAVRDQEITKSFQIHTGNVFWTLFMFFVLFFPLNLVNFKKIIAKIKNRSELIISAAVFAGLGVLLFPELDPMNTDPLHLKNRFLLYFYSGTFPEFLYLSVCIYSIFSLSVVDFIKKYQKILFVFVFLSLIPFWLVVSRYSILAFILFNTFRKKEAPLIEAMITVLFLVFSLYFLEGFLARKFLL